MVVVYIPTERCPKCPFNTLCKEERRCPISQQTPMSIPDMKEELRQYAKLQSLNPTRIVRELQTPRRDRRG